MAKYTCSGNEGICPHCDSNDTRIINKFERLPKYYTCRKCNYCDKNFVDEYTFIYSPQKDNVKVDMAKKAITS